MSVNIDSSTRKQTFKAIGIFLLAITCFDIMAVFVRILLAHYSAQELSAYRNVIGIIPSIVLLIYTRELTLNLSTLVIKQWRLALLRGVSVAVAQLCYYSAIGVLDLATVSTLGQTNAFFVVILSVIIIGEKVGIWRWAALLLGFLGCNANFKARNRLFFNLCVTPNLRSLLIWNFNSHTPKI